jgi:hypothetical protein
MKMKMYKKQVETLLNANPHLRDDDQKLLANMWWHYVIDVLSPKLNDEQMSGVKLFLEDLSKGRLPDGQSIRRCRRKLQELHPHLRGNKWDFRHEKAKKVKYDLKLFLD